MLNLGDKLCSQGVPSLELMVGVLQGVVPVLQALAFGVNAQLYPTYQQQITNIFLSFEEKIKLLCLKDLYLHSFSNINCFKICHKFKLKCRTNKVHYVSYQRDIHFMLKVLTNASFY